MPVASDSGGKFTPHQHFDPKIAEEGKLLWMLVRASLGPIPLSRRQTLALRAFLQSVIIPRLEPIEKAAEGRQDGGSLDSWLSQVPGGDEMTEQLDELHDARGVLNELNASQDVQLENPVTPLVPRESKAENKFYPSRTWVLIIGNNDYVVKPLSGCLHDARAMENYVKGPLGVHPDRVLKLENAKREEMIDALHTHFGRAQQGDALLFYYSGHGASYSLYDTDYGLRGAALEALCPTDRGTNPDGTVIQDISDRELTAILSTHAARIGPNITMILDCCFSRGSRLKEMASFRVVNEEEAEDEESQPGVRRIPPLAHGLSEMLAKAGANDRIDWAAFEALPTDHFWRADRASHVMITACQDYERTWEENGKGLFTSRLLKVLEHFPAKNISYWDILRCIGTVAFPEAQHPALLGDNSDSLFLQVGCHDWSCLRETDSILTDSTPFRVSVRGG